MLCARLGGRMFDGLDRSQRHVLFRDGPRTLQCLVSRRQLPRGAILTDAVFDPRKVSLRLRSLACFNELIASGRLQARYLPPEPRAARLVFVLRALDASLEVTPQRDIALALFEKPRVDADWADPREHLRDAVRRAVLGGRSLMNGGYRRLLS